MSTYEIKMWLEKKGRFVDDETIVMILDAIYEIEAEDNYKASMDALCEGEQAKRDSIDEAFPGELTGRR